MFNDVIYIDLIPYKNTNLCLLEVMNL